MEYHKTAIDNTCRVCTERAQSAKEIQNKKYPWFVTKFIDDIYVLFGIDISRDEPSIHSRKICDQCYRHLINSRQRGTQGPNCFEINLSGAYGELKDRIAKIPNIWKPHMDTNCSVCDNYRKQAFGGKKNKVPRGGSIKLKYDSTQQNIFSPKSDRPSSVTLPSINNCRIVNFSANREQNFVCNICKDVLAFQSVTTGCHYCATCLSGLYKVNATNTVKCPTCLLPVDYDSVKPVDNAFQNLISNLTVECCDCSSQQMYRDFVDHQCCAVNQVQGDSRDETLCKTPSGQIINVSLKRSLTSPLSKQEEKVHTHLTRRKLSYSTDNVMKVKTGGQPLLFMRVSKARITSANAQSPLKKRRARIIAKYRAVSAGKGSSSCSQQSTELKSLSNESRLQICEKAGVKQKAVLTCAEQLAMKTALGISWQQSRAFKRYCRSAGIKYASEKTERKERSEILQSQELKSEKILLWHKDEAHPNSIKGMVIKRTPSVYTKDLKELVCTRLDERERADMLTEFTNDEVWVKAGGDHGGGSFKFCLQLLNTKNPNSKGNTVVVGCFEAKDNFDNMKIYMNIFKEPLQALQDSQWHGKRIRIFIFGDYAFLTQIYGLSGAAGTYPCLWCLVNKNEMGVPLQQRTVQLRTLKLLKEDYGQFKINGSSKQQAKSYHNVIHGALLNIRLSHVCPPYLHILLGVVKLHHDLLETECHKLDVRIARILAVSHQEEAGQKTLFESYVDKLRKHRELKELESKTKKELDYEMKDNELPLEHRRSIQNALRIKLNGIQKRIKVLEEDTVLNKRSGPVTSNLSKILLKHRIVVQAFHSRSFVGNHCAKYLTETVYTDLTNSVETKVKHFTEEQAIVTDAETTAYRFRRINRLYSKIHHLVSHSKPIQPDQIEPIKKAINQYLTKFRLYFPDKFPPKLHMLEDHIVPWIERWGVGMALMGEQGGEACHREFNRLARTMYGIADPLSRLSAMMKEHFISTHPKIRKNIVHSRKRRLSSIV